jgi:hypothetical protein
MRKKIREPIHKFNFWSSRKKTTSSSLPPQKNTGQSNKNQDFCFVFVIESCWEAQAGLELTVLLPLPPKRWDYRDVPPLLTISNVLIFVFIFERVSVWSSGWPGTYCVAQLTSNSESCLSFLSDGITSLYHHAQQKCFLKNWGKVFPGNKWKMRAYTIKLQDEVKP